MERRLVWSRITGERIAALRRRGHGWNNFGKPTAVTWLDLVLGV